MQPTPTGYATPPPTPRRFSVLFWPHIATSSAWDLSDLDDSHRDEPIELSARLKLQQGQVYLHLTYRPCCVSFPEHSTLAPETQPARASGKHSIFAPLQRSAGHSRWVPVTLRPGRSSVQQNHSSRAPAENAHKQTTAPSTSSTGSPHRNPMQHYTIALTEILPLAAQFPLSAKLRSSLHLNIVDRDAATYSSHSTPCPPFVSLASSDLRGAPSALSSNFCRPSSCGPAATSSCRLENSLSSRRGSHGRARSLAATYGQYLDAAEPLHSNAQTPPSPLLNVSSRGIRLWPPSSCLGEGDVATRHHSPCSRTSDAPCGTGSRMLTPLAEKVTALQTLSTTHLRSSSVDSSGPPQLYATSAHLSAANSLLEYDELLGVAFFGVPQTARVGKGSSTDDEGHAPAGKTSRKFGHRKLSGTLMSSLMPLKKDLRQARSPRALSPHSEVRSDDLCGAATPLHLPHGFMPHLWKSNHASRPPVFASTGHARKRKVVELPFKLKEAQTFYLRFLNEADMHEFLNVYIEMQTCAKQAEDMSTSVKRRTKIGRRTSGDRRSGPPWLAEGGRENSVSRECKEYVKDDGQNSLGSSSPVASDEHYRDSKALGARGSLLCTELISDELLRDRQTAVWEELGGGHHDHDRRYTAFTALSTLDSSATHRRGWEDYVRHKADPRYGIRYATVPLFLWHSFLRFASSVLYTCQRGLLIVERLPTPSSPGNSEYGSRNLHCAGLDTCTEALKHSLNDCGRSPLSPIAAAQEVVPSTMQPRQREGFPNHEGVSEQRLASQVPVSAQKLPLPVSMTKSSGDDVKLVLSSVDSSQCQWVGEHISTFKDAFLCLSESHLLFLNSFGHVWFHFSFDEIVLITHSPATHAFQTHPFIRFRLKSCERFDTPTFALTFMLLPDVPHHMRLARGDASQRHPNPASATQPGSPPSTSSLSVSAYGRESWIGDHVPWESVAITDTGVSLVNDEEKERLLGRHKALLDIFETVCARPLERCTFTELVSGKKSKAYRARLRQLLSRASIVGSSAQREANSSGVHTDASLWMEQEYSATPILCIKLNAEDIYGAAGDTRRSERSHPHAPPVSLVPPRSSSTQRTREACHRLSPPHRAPCGFGEGIFARGTLRWGDDDPGIVVQDAGHDMDFSFERATRTMPLLARKEMVSQCKGGFEAHCQPHGLHPTHHGPDSKKAEKAKDEVAEGDSRGSPEEMYAPMAPKKRCSNIVRCVPMKEL
ncbi:hypothetical protein, unknown function [Leishmania tarentolae]|uniref:Uncharacterized protein n=1 Tax=Leishmania tarentolae TaxID=5689 RepID=A0A640KUN3_LEITA|nr:hypothetical protein, unknown function [Leishmania tarentolae]